MKHTMESMNEALNEAKKGRRTDTTRQTMAEVKEAQADLNKINGLMMNVIMDAMSRLSDHHGADMKKFDKFHGDMSKAIRSLSAEFVKAETKLKNGDYLNDDD
jgi:hypothetical protein